MEETSPEEECEPVNIDDGSQIEESSSAGEVQLDIEESQPSPLPVNEPEIEVPQPISVP